MQHLIKFYLNLIWKLKALQMSFSRSFRFAAIQLAVQAEKATNVGMFLILWYEQIDHESRQEHTTVRSAMRSFSNMFL